MNEIPEEKMKHLDEMALLLYIERQLDRARGLEVSAHTQECDSCRTLLRALERESRLLTRAMLEEDEPLPSRLAQFQERARKSMQWIWGLVFGLAATGAYALYTTYVQPWQTQLDQAGFGGSNLLGFGAGPDVRGILCGADAAGGGDGIGDSQGRVRQCEVGGND